MSRRRKGPPSSRTPCSSPWDVPLPCGNISASAADMFESLVEKQSERRDVVGHFARLKSLSRVIVRTQRPARSGSVQKEYFGALWLL